jgi:HK97 family phage portal protein
MPFFAGLLTTRAGQGAVERRAHPGADLDWAEWLGAVDRLAGLPTPSVQASLGQAAVWACVRVLSETVASLPLITYRQTADGGRERATNAPIYNILHRRPNPELTAFEMEELLTSHCATWGNGYAYLELANNGQVREMWPLRPDRMTVKRGTDGALVYVYQLPGGGDRILQAWQVHHRRGLSSDGIVGYSPVRVAMLAIALSMATEEFGARFFSQGARPGYFLSYPGVLKDDAFNRLDKRFNRQGGLSNAHRVQILEEGMKAETVGIPPDEAQFLQTRIFQAQEIARIFRMPPHKIGLLENATFSNIEHQAIEFVTDTIRPWVRRSEAAIWRDLLTESEKQTLYVEYLLEGILRGDTISRYQSYAIGRQWGWLSVNDIRRMENQDPVTGGDVYLQPMNMVEAGEPSPDQDQDQRSAVTWVAPLVEDAARRIVRREAQDLRTQGGKVLKSQPEQFETWLNEFYDGLIDAAGQMLAPAVAAAARAGGASEDRTAKQVRSVVRLAARDSWARARLVVREAAGQGMTQAQALEQYAGMVEAGAGTLAEQVLAVIAGEVE